MPTPEPPGSSKLELRVHGVGGSSPADMLGVSPDNAEQVAGNAITGFYRAKDGVLPGRELRGLPIAVEAYSWGRLTSGLSGILGGIRRALWLCLAPFAFANMAYWARAEINGSPKSRAMAALARLGAIGLTVFMVLIPSVIGVDLIAWQCYRGGSPGCTRLPGLLDAIAGLSPTQRLAVGSVVPLAFVLLLWLLSTKSLTRYEAVKSHPSRGTATILQRSTLWNGLRRTKQLQKIHLSVALAVVVAFPLVHARHARENGIGLDLLLTVTVALAVLATLWTLLVHPDDVDHGDSPTLSDRLGAVYHRAPAVLLVAMVATTLVNQSALWLMDDSINPGQDFFGHNLWFIAVFVALTVIHLAMFTAERFGAVPCLATVAVVLALAGGALWLHLRAGAGHDVRTSATLLCVATVALVVTLAVLTRAVSTDNAARAWRGSAPSVLLATAAWVALLFNTGVVFGVANFLNGDSHSAADLVSRLDEDTVEQALDPIENGRYVLTGDVVIRDAYVTGDSTSGLVVHSGSIHAERVFHSERVDGERVTLQKGRSEVQHGTITVESNRVLLQDSCRSLPQRDRCSPEQDHFTVGADVAAASGQLAMSIVTDDGGDDVELVPSSPPEVPLVVPQVLIWAPLMVGVWLVAVALWVLVAVLLMRGSKEAIDEGARTDGIDRSDFSEATRVRRAAAFAHRAEALLGVVGAFTSLLALALIGLSSTGKAPWVDHPGLRPLATMGLYLAVGLGLGLVVLAAQIRKSDGIRRVVGIVWDITTFWPRAAHPFAPPCYAERVVPEMIRRVEWALDSPEQPMVILSGHSQGSAIVAAVASRLPDEQLSRIRIVTYGSQIRGLYGRIFPAVFGPDQIGYVPTTGMATLGDIGADVPSRSESMTEPWSGFDSSLASRLRRAGGTWVNLFRRTDPIGWRVFSDDDTEHDRWVAEVSPKRRGNAGPSVATHSHYQFSPEYRQLMRDWTKEPFVDDPDGVVDVMPFPS